MPSTQKYEKNIHAGECKAKLTVEVERIGMFRAGVTTAIEEIEHLHWGATENQLSKGQDRNFVKVLIRKQTVCDQVTTSFTSNQWVRPLITSVTISVLSGPI